MRCSRMEEETALFPRKDEYSVGVEKLDQEHRKLVGFLNELYSAM